MLHGIVLIRYLGQHNYRSSGRRLTSVAIEIYNTPSKGSGQGDTCGGNSLVPNSRQVESHMAILPALIYDMVTLEVCRSTYYEFL